MGADHWSGKYLVVVADDLGKSSPVNRAIALSHERGIVTSASIMAGGGAFNEAVRIAHEYKTLSAGIHITLCDGKSVLPHSAIPDLVDNERNFRKGPFRAGIRYIRTALMAQVEKEIHAQFDILEDAGIYPTHIDSHHHLHMHPLIFRMLCRIGAQRGVQWIRLPREPVSFVARSFTHSRGIPALIERAALRMVAKYNARLAECHGLRSASAAYGLAHTGRLNEHLLMKMLRALSHPINELFVHPDMATIQGLQELNALISTGVHDLMCALHITPRGYKDIPLAAMPRAVGAE